MDQILSQLGELVLGSVPTMLFFILLVIAYGFLVRRPLDKVLAERRARTVGAMEQAREAISAAESETATYEDRLRRAKAEIYAMREARLKQWAQDRDRILEEARQSTSERVARGRAEIEQSLALAQQRIEAVSAELSEQVLRAVMPVETRQEVAR